MYVINAAIANKVKKLILISTDKATSATTCYGSTKFLMECMAYANESDTDIICTRYGNVFGSTGSVVPIFDKLVKENKPLTVRNGAMTRFFMPVSACVDIILHALELGQNGELWVYKSKACTIKDLADAFSNNQIVTGTESIEKNDEALITINELNHSKRCYNYYVIRKDYISEYIYLGFVEEIKDGKYKITQRNKFLIGDEIEIMKPGGENVIAKVINIEDEEGNVVPAASHAKQTLYITLSEKADEYDIFRVQNKDVKKP